MHAGHDGKVGCNTIEYTTAFMYSDGMYFLWHGINICIARPEWVPQNIDYL